MGLYKKILNHIKRRGLGGTLTYGVQKWLGVSNLQEETAAIFYILNQHISPRDFPRTSNEDLRILQDCDTALLGIFDKMCKKHGLTYWIEYGTLLGAVRHAGFIPWDDDTDVAMPRKDFEMAYELMHDEFEKYGITLEYDINNISSLRLHYRHHETGTWIDITPMDTFVSPYGLDETRSFLTPLIVKYIKYYDSHIKSPIKALWRKKEELIFNHQSGENRYMFHGQEFRQTKIRVLREADLIPCKRIEFNGIELNAPANPDEYLTYVYGKNYMGLPHGGIMRHGESMGRPPLDQWGKINGVDMNRLYIYLMEIYDNM